MKNPIGKNLLKLIPSSLVRKIINKNALHGLEEENEKAKSEYNR